MFIFDNVFPESTIDSYYLRISQHYENMLKSGCPSMFWYPSRNINIKNDPIGDQLQQYIESVVRVKLEISNVELQTWPVGSDSGFHIHKENNEKIGDFNSLLYLNDDFEGGEFITSKGIMIKPIKNRLTFFNGSKEYHGINPVLKAHRYTIIVWWRNTQFY